MSTTPSPTLPATWTPTKQGCLKTDDYWIFRWDLGGQDARTVQGGPSQTTDCFPSTWNPTGTYVGSGCPVQYTSACQGNDSASAVTCCPTAFNYACQTEAGTPGRHAEWFPCVSRHTTGGNITVTVTDFASNTIAVEKRGRNTNQHLFALGMVYTTPVSLGSDLASEEVD
ncbi:hypothetical protein F4778DRAFT_556734 [Xylariomycetidae sp. FL2044]|nr:hypothetical protein F4778DRAFT_556734 [Xylariomycetidae sp. FL2044]